MAKGKYFDGKNWVPCEVIRKGPKNTRIQVAGNASRLVPSNAVQIDKAGNSPSRIIPSTPLERLYRHIRSFQGSKSEKYTQLSQLLSSVRGISSVAFLVELYNRSVDQAAKYNNKDEGFYSDREDDEAQTEDEQSHFASEFVSALDQTKNEIKLRDDHSISYVDYEIAPFRTTLSSTEIGSPASRSGAGGMDLLLESKVDNKPLPAIGEIKAASESVGPTFALIQAMTYASQLTTINQASRLKKHYAGRFGSLEEDKPKVDILIFLENQDATWDENDLQHSQSLASELQGGLRAHIRRIVFAKCCLNNGQITFQHIKVCESASCRQDCLAANSNSGTSVLSPPSTPPPPVP